ncbi:MAG: hypothetical protein K1Y36_25330 [Blastocatellia bacterium]|nr:hypothetical protein [Blastocatellia bacterium]
MHVPKGRPVHENLSTSYVNLAALLAELQVNEFTGYVSVNFWNYEGFVFLDGGQLINASEQTETHHKRGREAIDSIVSRAQARGGAVSFFQHPQAVIRALAGIIDGEIIYRELASEFTNLERLIEKLKKNKESIWYIEVALEREMGAGVIYITDGVAEAVASIRETPESIELRTTAGAEGIAVLLAQVSSFGGVFNVYRAVLAVPQAITPSHATLHAMSAGVGALSPVSPPALVASTGTVHSLTGNFADDPVEAGVVEAIEEEPAPSLHTDTPGSPVSLTAEQYSELVNLMGEVIAAVEQGATEVVREGEFRIGLREAFLQAAEHYPFLDPFAGEFEYNAGEIIFLGSARPADFVVGLSQALHSTIADLARRMPESEVRSRVETALTALQRRRHSDFEKFGLEIALEEILGR